MPTSGTCNTTGRFSRSHPACVCMRVCVHARASVRVCVCARVPPCLPASLLRTCPLRHLVPSVLYRSLARTLWPPISRTQSLSSLLSRHANDTLSDSGTNSQQMTASSFSKIRHLSNCARVRASTHVRHRELCVFARGCVRACVRACMRACMHAMRASVHVCADRKSVV